MWKGESVENSKFQNPSSKEIPMGMRTLLRQGFHLRRGYGGRAGGQEGYAGRAANGIAGTDLWTG